MSEEYGLKGKIDIYKGKEQKLIERKYQLKKYLFVSSLIYLRKYLVM